MIVKRLLIMSVAIVVVIILALAALTIVPRQRPHISPAAELIAGNGNVVRLNLEIANTTEERAHGLMNRSSLAADAGMLFVFDDDRIRYFWMKDTLISLDMLFIDDNLTIIDIHENATPLSETMIASSGPCRYVLEVNGGLCETYGVGVGDRVKLDFYR